MTPFEASNNNNITLTESFDTTDQNQSRASYGDTNAQHTDTVDVERRAARGTPPPPPPQRRGRPRVVPLSDRLLRERRDAANARERKRMNQMTRSV